MELLSQSRKTDRNRFTRMCIGEALISLMAQKPLEAIKISDIAKRAGISRMTYYKYYQTKVDILSDYLEEIVAEYRKQAASRKDVGQFHDYTHILFSLEFFDQYRHFLLTLVHANLYSIIINAINKYMAEHVLPQFEGSVYELYYYAGALLNLFLTWTDKEDKEPAQEIARIVDSFLHLR